MDHGTMDQHQQQPARTSTALGGGTVPGNGSGRQTEQQNGVKCREWGVQGARQGGESQRSEGREEISARLQLCQQVLPLECSPARGWGHQELLLLLSKARIRPWSSSTEQPLPIPYPSPRWDTVSKENFPFRACLSSPFLQGKQRE